MKWTAVPATGFAQHSARWHELHARCGGHALLAADFVAPLVTHFGSGAEMLAWCEQDGRTVAMAVVAPAARGSWSTFQPAQAPVALWLQEPGADIERLCHGLMRALPGFPLVFGVTQLDPAMLPRPAHTPCIGTLDYIDTARVTIAGTFDGYWNKRGKNLRANLKKQRAKLDKEGIATRLEICTDPHAVAQAVADYGMLESSGWKAGCGTAVHAENAQGRYYREMLEASCRRGAGSIYRYFFGERLVAMDLCVEDADRVVVLKTSYDESAAGSLSPTLLMREEACRRLFEEGRVRRLEFYGRVMEWHLRWTDEVRTMYHVNCYRWPGLRRLHSLLESRARSHAAGTSSPESDYVPERR
ncbi:MAG TPA: GNAT family N-acetyltransferase [Telluria sp.]|nr:GNAT family N-acetyltransferase [Telluria sp.]